MQRTTGPRASKGYGVSGSRRRNGHAVRPIGEVGGVANARAVVTGQAEVVGGRVVVVEEVQDLLWPHRLDPVLDRIRIDRVVLLDGDLQDLDGIVVTARVQ